MSEQHAGKCLGGPYDGETRVYHEKTILVQWIEGNPLHEICFKREGQYNWHRDMWLWSGPKVNK